MEGDKNAYRKVKLKSAAMFYVSFFFFFVEKLICEMLVHPKRNPNYYNTQGSMISLFLSSFGWLKANKWWIQLENIKDEHEKVFH